MWCTCAQTLRPPRPLQQTNTSHGLLTHIHTQHPATSYNTQIRNPVSLRHTYTHTWASGVGYPSVVVYVGWQDEETNKPTQWLILTLCKKQLPVSFLLQQRLRLFPLFGLYSCIPTMFFHSVLLLVPGSSFRKTTTQNSNSSGTVDKQPSLNIKHNL